ncbi:tRNA (adenosine(37)-N6)-threonylcarbamoyltransferase complex dimerization subunit type 1 TsaB [Pontibacillus yanchengensis]|uniref:tRNA (Adenosine(37)-N6)-threonylcarbamoyltransferase complex dimerization subunit type 1 TsaB n=2 Tax=Pontibacillus yanchengensis TaxID=462910 RepID=A0ACC7VM89_9BACI|nr:tRNA (adenosine(37)-N6)-threonylcarbamoyltransferase complex dimerization subunit type 1 TsaB [Pontibacillus yanchengensis]MYL35735.1 tRNA (adenosine(37)-N6)-threonylcarbamoyltransferase complex dimerization subunit type 1 TsaB [Pontibacillus yanchengensis]MYL55444.1 tRNA (adenosine(37)-N6)-threonylcarbamoyltransferase complex dimerization subunit type 1 TsaB [Pontibacillus yanchengensis]
MNVLAIDTSNQALGVALVRENEVIAEYSTNVKRNHSVQLMPAIDHLMKETNMTPQDLDRIAVANGPGSFTGVRIGLTTAKTLAWSLTIPIVAISSLEVIARNGHFFNGYICPFFDARRGMVYTSLYASEDGELVPVEDEVNILLTEWLERVRGYEKPILFISSQLSTHQSVIKEQLGDQAVCPQDLPVHLPRAGEIAKLAISREPSSVHELTPNYLRLAEAESKWLAAQQEKQKDG